MISLITKTITVIAMATIFNPIAVVAADTNKTSCEVVGLQPDTANFFAFGGRKAPSVGDILLLDFTTGSMTEIGYSDGSFLARPGDITLTSSFMGSYSGIRHGMFGTYLAHISEPLPSGLGDGSFNSTIRISRGAFLRDDPTAIYSASEIHTAELLCSPPQID